MFISQIKGKMLEKKAEVFGQWRGDTVLEEKKYILKTILMKNYG